MQKIIVILAVFLVLCFCSEALATATPTATPTRTPTPTATPANVTRFGALQVGDTYKPLGSTEKDIYFESGAYLDGTSSGNIRLGEILNISGSVFVDQNISIGRNLYVFDQIMSLGSITTMNVITALEQISGGSFKTNSSTFEVGPEGYVHAVRYNDGSAYIDYNTVVNQWDFYNAAGSFIGSIP